MKILLDSHFLLWIGYNKIQEIPNYAKQLIENPDNQIYFSLVSIWELYIKEVLEKLRIGLLQTGFYELPITHRHIFEVKKLTPNAQTQRPI